MVYNVIVSWSVVDHGVQGSSETKHFKIGISFFSTKYPTLRSKSNDWLAWNQYNVSEWSDTSA